MDDGYARFRRLNDELNREGRRQQREALETMRARHDAERRHRELVAATRASGTIPHNSPSASPWSGVSWKTVLCLGALVLVLYIVSASLGRTPRATTGAAPSSAPLAVGSAASPELPVAAAQNSAGDEPDAAPVTPDMPSSSNMDALKGPILRALDSGERVAWDADGVVGYVSVSAIVETGDGTCRTVQVDGGANRDPTESGVWCKKGGADWAQVARPAR